MASMLAAERRNKIAEILVANGSIKIKEMSEMFSVSTETIRKDLIYLNKIGVAQKSHGGALSSLELIEKPLEDRENKNSDLKNIIAQKTMELIPEHAVIFLDAGSTTLYIAKLLSLKSGYTIITNSISAVNMLVKSENIVHMTGGEVNGIIMSLVGFGAVNFLSKVKADIAILGSSGFQGHNGPASKDFDDAEVKRLMIANSKSVVVIADSTKAESTALVEYCGWDETDYFVTDSNISKEVAAKIQNKANVLIAEDK